jgi:hypothetical protein
VNTTWADSLGGRRPAAHRRVGARTWEITEPVILFDAAYGGRSASGIQFCPWCGARLPESERDRWFDELQRQGIDPWTDDIPAEYEDDRWLNR